MMAYLKPPWFTAKIFNKIAMATGISGSETLTVTRRSSGEAQQIPGDHRRRGRHPLPGVHPRRVAVGQEHPGHPDGDVGALAPAPPTTLPTEIPVDQREPVLAAYQAKAGQDRRRLLPQPAADPPTTRSSP